MCAPGDTVAVLGPKAADQIPALLGIHAMAPCLPIGADQPAERAARILATGAVVAVLTAATARNRRSAGDDSVEAMTVGQAIAAGLPRQRDLARR